MFTPENYGRNPTLQMRAATERSLFRIGVGGQWRISSGGSNEPEPLIFLVGAFDLIETPSRIDLFRMP